MPEEMFFWSHRRSTNRTGKCRIALIFQATYPTFQAIRFRRCNPIPILPLFPSSLRSAGLFQIPLGENYLAYARPGQRPRNGLDSLTIIMFQAKPASMAPTRKRPPASRRPTGKQIWCMRRPTRLLPLFGPNLWCSARPNPNQRAAATRTMATMPARIAAGRSAH